MLVEVVAGGDLDLLDLHHVRHVGRIVQLDLLADTASRVAELQGSSQWAQWILATYARLEIVPPFSVVQRIAALPNDEPVSEPPNVWW